MTVRISDKLTTMVIENISSLYRKKLEELDKQKPDVGDRLYEIIYGPYIADMERLPEGFLRKINRFETKRVGDEPHAIFFDLTSHRLSAWSHPVNEHVTSSGYGDKLDIKRTAVTEEIVDAILSWRQKIGDLMVIRENGQKAVRGILKRHASLPPAIKAFPPLIDLLSPEVRKKVDVPQHKLTSVEMELNPHLKQLATDIALNKFFNR